MLKSISFLKDHRLYLIRIEEFETDGLLRLKLILTLVFILLIVKYFIDYEKAMIILSLINRINKQLRGVSSI